MRSVLCLLLTMWLFAGCGDPPSEPTKAKDETPVAADAIPLQEAEREWEPDRMRPRIRIDEPDRSALSVQIDVATYTHIQDTALDALVREVTLREATGVTRGIEITAVTRGSLLDLFDLRTGDVITSIGDREATRVEDVVHLFELLKAESRFEVWLVRRGRPTLFRLSGRDPQKRRGSVPLPAEVPGEK
ncbi:MAG: hypothetical protein QNJ98_14310 [Planctomycetota bacterium]|nr:hypothetical protein [Planctomycetota bacterium]